MKISLLTYNLLLNDATVGLKKLIEENKPDIVTLQEVDTTNHILDSIKTEEMQLADYANTFIKFGKVYGVATFYDSKKYEYIHSEVIPLPKGVFEIVSNIFSLLRNTTKQRVVLCTEFRNRETNKKILVYNIHLSAASTNSLRLKQLKTTFAEIENDYEEPIVLLGDFNYTFGRNKLEELTQEFGFKESTDKIDFTFDGRITHYTFAEKIIFKIYQKLYQKTTKNDYVFYKNCKHIETKKIDIRLSDHYPLLAEFEV